MIIDEIEGVEASAVVGVNASHGDIVHAFVIKNPVKELSAELIKDYVNSRVIEEKSIRGGVYFVDKFPSTVSGKIKRNELRKIAENK